MKTVYSLPVLPESQPELQLHPEPPARLPRVERVPRLSPLLHDGPMPDFPDVLSLNLAQGCAHRCVFCSARAYPSYRGDDVIYLYEDAPQRLAAELAARRTLPRAVYLSPATDPFMPLVEVQRETAQVVEVLAHHGVEALLMTRGYIRPAAMETLARHASLVRVTMSLTTMDRVLQRALEPLAAPPRHRLRQIAQLRQRGVPVSVQIAPLVPGVTDQRENLLSLLAALASVGVQQVSTGYMFLRSGIRENLSRSMEAHGWGEGMLDEFLSGPVLAAGNVQAARYLPRQRRQQGYATLMTLAAVHGIRVSVCGLTNPDFQRRNSGSASTLRESRLRQRA
jgi:DNA repair photolyase